MRSVEGEREREKGEKGREREREKRERKREEKEKQREKYRKTKKMDRGEIGRKSEKERKSEKIKNIRNPLILRYKPLLTLSLLLDERNEIDLLLSTAIVLAAKECTTSKNKSRIWRSPKQICNYINGDCAMSCTKRYL